MLKIILPTLLFLLFLYFCPFFYWLFRAKAKSRKTIAYKKDEGNFIIQIHGDSTALGTGATAPEKSLAGLIGSAYSNASVQNYGALGRNIASTVRCIEQSAKPDLMVVCCGGSDIMYFRSLKRVKQDIEVLFSEAEKKSKNIILFTPINLGFSSAFPFFLRSLYKKRSLVVGSLFADAANRHPSVCLVNCLLLDEISKMPPWNQISSSDRLHPNDIGYAWVYSMVKNKLTPN